MINIHTTKGAESFETIRDAAEWLLRLQPSHTWVGDDHIEWEDHDDEDAEVEAIEAAILEVIIDLDLDQEGTASSVVDELAAEHGEPWCRHEAAEAIRLASPLDRAAAVKLLNIIDDDDVDGVFRCGAIADD